MTAWLAAADRMVDQGRVLQALKVCREALSSKGEDAGVLLRAAGLEERLGRREAARGLYTRAQQLPGCPPVFLRCAVARSCLLAFQEDGDADPALSLLDKSLATDPSHIETLDVKAYVLAGSRPDEARELHRHICRMDPSHSLVDCLYFRHIFAKGTVPYPKPHEKAAGDDVEQGGNSGPGRTNREPPPVPMTKTKGAGRKFSNEHMLQWGLMSGVSHQAERSLRDEELSAAQKNWVEMTRGLKRKLEAVTNVQKVLIMAGLYGGGDDSLKKVAMESVKRGSHHSQVTEVQDVIKKKDQETSGLFSSSPRSSLPLQESPRNRSLRPSSLRRITLN